MIRKKSKFITFCCSLFPGAGEMYMGFMKLGVSIMALFFVIFSLSTTLNIPYLVYLLPIIWFYSFFNVHNISSLPDDEFYALEDHYLFSSNEMLKEQFSWFYKHKKLLSYTLIFFGFSILWSLCENIMEYFFYNFFSNELSYFFMNLIRSLPQSVIGIALIIIGFRLLKDKKDSLEKNSNLPSA